MATYKQTDSVTRRTHRSGNRGYLPDQTIQLAAGRCGLGCDYREAARRYPAKTKGRPHRIYSACLLRCHSDRELDFLDKISVWRSHRISRKNHFAWLDTQTVSRLVAASNFYAAGFLGFLVGPHH